MSLSSLDVPNVKLHFADKKFSVNVNEYRQINAKIKKKTQLTFNCVSTYYQSISSKK